jgi:hypothetical protein
LETFTKPKALVENPHYHDQRQKCLVGLNDGMIDKPIIDLVSDLNKLPHFFTLQCCYGHFIYSGQNNPNNLEPLPTADAITKVKYRIAYIAFCIENSEAGRGLLETLKEVTCIDPENIQFCSAEWFWNKQINSYALQVEPDRYKRQDTAIINFKEALHIEKTRNTFFVRLRELLEYTKEM